MEKIGQENPLGGCTEDESAHVRISDACGDRMGPAHHVRWWKVTHGLHESESKSKSTHSHCFCGPNLSPTSFYHPFIIKFVKITGQVHELFKFLFNRSLYFKKIFYRLLKTTKFLRGLWIFSWIIIDS